MGSQWKNRNLSLIRCGPKSKAVAETASAFDIDPRLQATALRVLETTAQILIVPPFYENLGKRLIKSPKVYLADSGLACHLLGIDTTMMEMLLVHQAPKAGTSIQTVAPGVRALPWQRFVAEL